jgi:hypothetical protein
VTTTRLRHLITETDQVAAAIDRVLTELPGASRADALRHLIITGAELQQALRDNHRRRVRELAGGFPGLYPQGYLDDLRAEWPA